MKQNLLNLGYAVVAFVVAAVSYSFGSGYESGGPGDMMALFADIAFLSAPLLAVLGLWYLYRAASPQSDTDDTDADAT